MAICCLYILIEGRCAPRFARFGGAGADVAVVGLGPCRPALRSVLNRRENKAQFLLVIILDTENGLFRPSRAVVVDPLGPDLVRGSSRACPLDEALIRSPRLHSFIS